MNENNLKYAGKREKSNISRAKEERHEWKNMDWEKAERYVNRLQIRIVKAKLSKKNNLVKRLQHLIVNSYYAKAIAVRKVTRNKGKRTAGIDGEIWNTDKQKMEAIEKLKTKGYKAKPNRRILIKKQNGKDRPLSIPIMKDRAMQTLQLLSLQPIEETVADENSYGFRMYRGCKDAMEKIFTVLSRKNSAEWILEGDIRGCFDNISHEWLIKNIPMEKKILREFIKAGYIYKKKLFPTNKGAIQGGAISPTLANLTLDGLEEEIHNQTNPGKKVKYLKHREHKINFIRFADDFIVTGESKEVLEKVKEIVKEFLNKRGLELSEEKTMITSIEEGFDFLGWNFKKYRGKLIIKPSKKSVDKVSRKISEVIKSNKSATAKKLILELNPIINGWGNYHQSVCSKEIFGKIDNKIYEMLWKWTNRKHNNKSKKWIIQKYWSKKDNRKWKFTAEGKELRRMSEIPIIRHTLIAKNKNPYLNKEYFEDRKRKQQEKRIKAYKNTATYKLYMNNSLEVTEA